MSRPCKLTPDLQAELCSALSRGVMIEEACASVGISRSTFYAWRERGEAGEQPFSEFLDTANSARARAVISAVEVILNAAQRGDWKAAAWWLERTHPERYGRRTAIAEPVQVQVSQSDTSEREQRLRALVDEALERKRGN